MDHDKQALELLEEMLVELNSTLLYTVPVRLQWIIVNTFATKVSKRLADQRYRQMDRQGFYHFFHTPSDRNILSLLGAVTEELHNTLIQVLPLHTYWVVRNTLATKFASRLSERFRS